MKLFKEKIDADYCAKVLSDNEVINGFVNGVHFIVDGIDYAVYDDGTITASRKKFYAYSGQEEITWYSAELPKVLEKYQKGPFEFCGIVQLNPPKKNGSNGYVGGHIHSQKCKLSLTQKKLASLLGIKISSKSPHFINFS